MLKAGIYLIPSYILVSSHNLKHGPTGPEMEAPKDQEFTFLVRNQS